MNRVAILGRVGKDPEVRAFPNGDKLANIRVATSERWKDKATGERKEKTEWHSVAVFGGAAGIVEQYVRKGDQILIEGQLQTRKWQDQSGADRYTTEIVVKPFSGSVELIGGKKPDGGAGSGGDDRGYQKPPTDDGGTYGDQQQGSGGRNNLDDEIPF